MNTLAPKKVAKIAFIVPEFPATSLTFIINQVADLVDRGVEVEIFALRRGGERNISERYHAYDMRSKTVYLTPPQNKIIRLLQGAAIALRLLLTHPSVLRRSLDSSRYGAEATSLFTLFWVYPFLGKKFDIVHCHFGTVATKYLKIRSILGDTTNFITTFYGYDVSHTPKVKGMDCYAELISACSLFLVMSENMKSRVLPLGVPEEKIVVHPISVDVSSYPYKERSYRDGEVIQAISVGRFVEKKGFDDLLRAVKIVKEKATKPFRLTIVGDGELHDEMHGLAKELGINDVVDFKGYMKLEDVLNLYETSHLYVQASKTARDGDME